ncbi:MAG: protein kinase [Thermoanaerobaculia bacterium]|nr:protein kinase [Thermoanaerobaculia bacterium]
MPISKPFRILVVDDDEATREVCSSLLRSRGHRVECAASGTQALKILKQEADRLDMVLLDLVMPEKDGFQTLREIRSEHPRARLPVFVLTARDGSDDIYRALEVGADDYVVKPLDAGIALSKIQATLELRRAAYERTEVGPGDRLDAKYQLEEPLGSGGFGTVFRATHLDLDLNLAIKVLHGHAFADFRSRRRLKTEGRVLARLDHPNTVRVWDLVTTQDPPYLVMDFLEGRPLSEAMVQGGPMTARLVCRLAEQMVKGLRAAHRLNLVHRDVKPQNIFLCKNQPEGNTVKLLDFGLSGWALEGQIDAGSSASDELLGTPRYLAPERIQGDRGGKPSDIYSLGIVLFEMLTGSFPYPISSGSLASLIQAHSLGKVSKFSDLGVTVPALLEGLIRWTLRREPEERPDCDQVLASLAGIRSSIGKDPGAAIRKNLDFAGRDDTEPIDLSIRRDDREDGH